jgi:hypothetical protein
MANNISPLLSALLECLCTQLSTDGHPVCECCVVVSDDLPPMTGCDCICEGAQGRAWVRFVSADFQQTELTKCPIGPWQVTLQLGVYRCISSEPTCETTTTEADAAAEDLASIQRAILCCPVLGGRRYTLSDAEVIGPLGGCIGVAMRVVIDVATL